MDDAFFLFPSGDKTKRRDDGTDELSCRSKSFSVRNTRPEKARGGRERGRERREGAGKGGGKRKGGRIVAHIG